MHTGNNIQLFKGGKRVSQLMLDSPALFLQIHSAGRILWKICFNTCQCTRVNMSYIRPQRFNRVLASISSWTIHVSRWQIILHSVWNYLFPYKSDKLHENLARYQQRCVLLINRQITAHMFTTGSLACTPQGCSHYKGRNQISTPITQEPQFSSKSKCKSIKHKSTWKEPCPGSGRLLAVVNIWALLWNELPVKSLTHLRNPQSSQTMRWKVALNEGFWALLRTRFPSPTSLTRACCHLVDSHRLAPPQSTCH